MNMEDTTHHAAMDSRPDTSGCSARPTIHHAAGNTGRPDSAVGEPRGMDESEGIAGVDPLAGDRLPSVSDAAGTLALPEGARRQRRRAAHGRNRRPLVPALLNAGLQKCG